MTAVRLFGTSQACFCSDISSDSDIAFAVANRGVELGHCHCDASRGISCSKSAKCSCSHGWLHHLIGCIVDDRYWCPRQLAGCWNRLDLFKPRTILNDTHASANLVIDIQILKTRFIEHNSEESQIISGACECRFEEVTPLKEDTGLPILHEATASAAVPFAWQRRLSTHWWPSSFQAWTAK